jgi:hypothetical protein
MAARKRASAPARSRLTSVLGQTLQPPEVLATKATPSGFDLDKGGMRGGLVAGVPGIVMAAVSAGDASKPILRGPARRPAADPVKLAGVELVHKDPA